MEAKPQFTWPESNLTWLEHRTIFLTVHGSHAYGTNRPGSDLDVRGVCIPPSTYYHGYQHNFESAQSHGNPDLTVYELRKFFRLCADANPNALEILFTDPRHHLRTTFLGNKLLAGRDLFLSRKAKRTFGTYPMSQIKMIDYMQFNSGDPHTCREMANAIRHLRMGYEILSGQGVQVYRKDQEELKSILDGIWQFDRLMAEAEKLHDLIEEVDAVSTLPAGPDYIALDALCVKLVEMTFGE